MSGSIGMPSSMRARRNARAPLWWRRSPAGAFDAVRDLMGEEMACLAYYDQPELMADILETLRNTATNVLARMSERVTIDQLSMHEDLAGRSGPLIGPRQVEEWFQPYYRAC